MPLQITVRTAKPAAVAGDVLVVGAFSGASAKKKKGAPDSLSLLDRALGGGLSKLMAREEFKAKKDQSVRLPILGKIPFHTLIVLGLGNPKAMTDADARAFAGRAARAAQTEKARRLTLALPEGLESRLRFVTEGLFLGAYRFDKYLTGDRAHKAHLGKVVIVTSAPVPASAKDDVALGEKKSPPPSTCRATCRTSPRTRCPPWPSPTRRFASRRSTASA